MIEIDELCVRYGELVALQDVEGRIPDGTSLAVVGPNGGGKSTLLKAIAGVVTPCAGRVRTNGARIAYLPQQSAVERSVPITVADLVSFGLWRETGWFGSVDRRGRGRIEEALATVGLAAYASRRIDALSAGQLQRALFARLLLDDAEVVLLDEPFTAMDAASSRQLAQLFTSWHAEGRTIIAALHDLAEVRTYFPETLVVAGRPLAWGRTDEVLTPQLVARAFAFATAEHQHADPHGHVHSHP
jgi:zinc/manganese transport system ATP-binding protein